MKEFNLIITKDEEVHGEGSYQKLNEGLMIETKGSSVNKFLRDALRQGTRIRGMHFKGKESDGAFSGPFIVKNMKDNTFIIKKL